MKVKPTPASSQLAPTERSTSHGPSDVSVARRLKLPYSSPMTLHSTMKQTSRASDAMQLRTAKVKGQPHAVVALIFISPAL